MVDVVKQDMNLVWASSGDIVAPDEDKITTGWGVEVVPRQWWNWMQNRVDTNVAYMLQKGIPEWDATTEYITNKSYVQYQGVIYRAIATSTNAQPSLTSPQWAKAFTESTASSEAFKALTPVVNGLPYFTGVNSAAITVLTPFARTLLDDTDASSMRSTLALGTIATQNSNNVSITGGSVSGITDISVADGGTGASTPAQARVNLGTDDAANLTTGVVPINRLSGNYNIGVTGNAATSTVLQTSRNINGVPFNGSANITIFDETKLPLTGGVLSGVLTVNSRGTFVKNDQTSQTTAALEVGSNSGDVWLSLNALGSSAIAFKHTRGSNSIQLFNSSGASGDLVVGTITATSFTGNGANITNLVATNIATGIIPIARGGTGTGTSTGTGSVVLASAPTVENITLTGVPTAPTAAFGTDNDQVATTAFVRQNAAAMPTGSIIQVASTTAPGGFMKANGAVVSRTTYSDLFAVIGTTFGAGDGSTTFALPDLRGEFVRGWDDGRGVDVDRVFGSLQAQSLQSHNHTASSSSAGDHSHTLSGSTDLTGSHTHRYSDPLTTQSSDTRGTSAGGATTKVFANANGVTGAAGDHSHTINGTTNTTGAHSHTITVDSAGGLETRPRNIALLYCIKF